MPANSALSLKIWNRYVWARDHGHTKYVEKAQLCERFFAGDQWDREDLAALKASRRPALTINKIISTVGNVLGEQIYNRAETSFRPRSGSPAEIADVLTKVFKQISDNNQLDWKRSEMFADGVIGSRGYLDLRLGYGDSAHGEVQITNLNPRNVIPDPDADDYDPDSWGEVFVTKWVTADDIAVMYSKTDAALLRNKDGSQLPYGYDSIDGNRERFGDAQYPTYGDFDETSVLRNIRLIERQYRVLDRQQHFLSPETGDMRQVPESFDRNRIAWFVEKFGFKVVPKMVRRIRWTVVADDVVLHDDWSPYKHFTVVPFFPHFRKGNTIGLVESLIGSQELLNKVSSQELHVVNTTANSGYIVSAGGLTNMTPEELEQRGAETGVVIQVNGDIEKTIKKIQPNTVPQGLDRISYKAEEHIKTISGISDSMQGFDREDVAAKAIQAKRQAGSTNLVKPLDSLTRSDYILARNTLDIVQEFYTAEQLLSITKDSLTGETETFAINQPNPISQQQHQAQGLPGAYQAILNDLTIGEYSVVVSSVPRRETLEDSQFEQAVSLKELGVPIPDSVLIGASRLIDKADVIKQMEATQNSPEAQAAKQLEQRGMAAEVAKTEAEAKGKHADAGLKGAKTAETVVKTQVLANTPIDTGEGQQGNPELEMAQAQHEADMSEREFAHKQRMDMMEFQRKRQESNDKLALQAQDAQQKRIDAQAQQAQQAAAAAQKPTPASKV